MNNIHQSAVIDKDAVIEDGVEIGPYTIIGPEVIIKSGTKIHGHAAIEYSEIGKNCEIFNFSSIGKRPQDLKYEGEHTNVIIGDGTTIREAVTVNRGTKVSGKTVVGKNCLLMSCAHVAHDCILGDGVIVGYSTGIAGHVEVGDWTIFSGGCGVHQFCKIGRQAMIAGGAKVTMDVIPYATAHGDRAVLVGLNIIGMKRSKMSLAEIDDIKTAYKTLFTSNLTLADALKQIEAMPSPYVNEIADFIKSSQRGVMRP
jgi:UDP-N-acetylglucosamine acyltransferase